MANWTDKDMVMAVMRHDNVALERYYGDCKSYFRHHASALFVDEANVDDIFHDALVHLWREIETRRIELSEGKICRWNDGRLQPMTSSLLTFLLAVAKRKHWEQVRRQHLVLLTGDDRSLDVLGRDRWQEPAEGVSETEQRERVVADLVLAMSGRCREILTLFYYEHRTLDEILELRQENQSKQGLKTSKYKCMQRLREQVRERFRQLHLAM